MESLSIRAFRDELEKIAVFSRLVRLGATDIPRTPRLIMKKRGPQELANLQKNVETGYDKTVSAPIRDRLMPYAEKLQEGTKRRAIAEKLVHMTADDPIGHAAIALGTAPIPAPPGVASVPIHFGYEGAKKGIEKGIDKLFPLPAAKISH
jgi:hypothetical protein